MHFFLRSRLPLRRLTPRVNRAAPPWRTSAGAAVRAISGRNCSLVRDRNRKCCLTQHHGKIAPTLFVADILTSGKEGKGAVMGAYALFLRSRRPLRRLTARVNRADASVADVCWRSRQSNFRTKLLSGTRPEPQVLPDAASRQNSPNPVCRGYFDVRQGRQGRGDGSVCTFFAVKTPTPALNRVGKPR